MDKLFFPLEKEFFRWIKHGMLIAAIFFVASLLRPFLCHAPYQKDISASNSDANTPHQKTRVDHASEKRQRQPNESNDQHSHAWICDVDLKPTDIAIAFFTYCLVMVGWFTLRSGDANTKNGQRAFLVAGPLFGVPNNHDGTDDWNRRNRAKASMFHGPYRMALINFGKTAAFITKVEWGLWPYKEFQQI